MTKPTRPSKTLALLWALLLLGPTVPPRADEATPAAPAHVHGPLCHLGPVIGFGPDVRASDTIVVGRATAAGAGEHTVAVTRVVRGDPATRSVRVRGRDDAPERRIRAGTPSLLLLRRQGADLVPVAALDLADPDNAGAEGVVVALADLLAKPRTAAALDAAASSLTDAVSAGGATVRARAALDLNGDAALIARLEAADVKRLQDAVAAASAHDAALVPLIEVLGLRNDAGTLGTLLAVLDKPRADKVEAALERVLKGGRIPGSVAALAARLAAPTRAARVQAAHLLARVDTAEARAALGGLILSPDDDLQAEALVAHAGVASPPARQRAYDVVRLHLRGASPAPRTRLEQLLRERAIHDARTLPPAGLDHRLRAAAFVLARSPDPADRAWLRTHLDRLDDPAAAAFVADRLDSPWADFDQAW
jgi:hypothetical protein